MSRRRCRVKNRPIRLCSAATRRGINPSLKLMRSYRHLPSPPPQGAPSETDQRRFPENPSLVTCVCALGKEQVDEGHWSGCKSATCPAKFCASDFQVLLVPRQSHHHLEPQSSQATIIYSHYYLKPPSTRGCNI